MKILSYLSAKLRCDFFFTFLLKADHDLWGPPDLLLYAERDFSPDFKRPGREADQSPPSSAEEIE